MKAAIEINPPFWIMPSADHYTKWINETFRYVNEGDMFPHQRFVRDFMQENSINRGLLLYHGLGVGKTRSAIAIAETSVNREIVVLLPASLRPNFESEVEKVQGEKQYSYVHYDGLNSKRVKELDSFDNKLLIIDEVHTFISRVIGVNNKVARETYQKIMEAENCKIVALTGTPIINTPFELACTLNLIQGYIYFTTYFPISGSVWSKAQDEISRLENVQKVVPVVGGFSVYLTPPNFERRDDTKLVLKATATEGDKIMEVLKAHGIKLKSSPKIDKTSLFPIFRDEFTDLYIDYKNSAVLKTDDFLNKVQGLVSYFEAYDAKAYPVQNPIEYVNIPMKKIQFGKYIMVRQKEVDTEFKARKNDKNDDMKSGNVYRAFSRALCNFVFPDEIKRPSPSTMKQFKQEVDDFEDDLGETQKEKKVVDVSTYDLAVARAVQKLEANASKYLSKTALAEYGPKFNAIMDRLETCPGSALIYSTFRNVEGIKIMSLILNHNGYAELRAKKDSKTKQWKLQCSDFEAKHKYIVFTKNKEENRILMNIFNSEMTALPPNIVTQLGGGQNLKGEMIKVMMITQSGAQGISLKNVRQVHIMEPFWNNIRVMQVRGRAIRAMSHIALPVKDRVVDTFMYIMTLENKEHIDHPLIKGNDKGMTSDGYILDIALRKAVINDQFLQLVKNAAVDCGLNKAKHGNKVKCWRNAAAASTSARKKTIVKPLFKAFIVKKLNREFLYLANPTDEQKEEFKRDREGEGWTALYAPATKLQIGLVRVDPDGTPRKIVMN